jgi:hypothetical protein
MSRLRIIPPTKATSSRIGPSRAATVRSAVSSEALASSEATPKFFHGKLTLSRSSTTYGIYEGKKLVKAPVVTSSLRHRAIERFEFLTPYGAFRIGPHGRGFVARSEVLT